MRGAAAPNSLLTVVRVRDVLVRGSFSACSWMELSAARCESLSARWLCVSGGAMLVTSTVCEYHIAGDVHNQAASRSLPVEVS